MTQSSLQFSEGGWIFSLLVNKCIIGSVLCCSAPLSFLCLVPQVSSCLKLRFLFGSISAYPFFVWYENATGPNTYAGGLEQRLAKQILNSCFPQWSPCARRTGGLPCQPGIQPGGGRAPTPSAALSKKAVLCGQLEACWNIRCFESFLGDLVRRTHSSGSGQFEPYQNWNLAIFEAEVLDDQETLKVKNNSMLIANICVSITLVWQHLNGGSQDLSCGIFLRQHMNENSPQKKQPNC